MRGIRKFDFTIDPPPDLAIEIDLTSKTKLDVYQAIAVPELWIYVDNSLKIYLLNDNDGYTEAQFSPIFGNIPIREIIPHLSNRFLLKVEVGRSEPSDYG